ncbi:MAG TPA: serine kinase [Alphaproteobacteria bacterium]|nr:serine kinase [Alphaproteobacteria bacterium]
MPCKDVGVFVVRGGREIHVMPAPGADDDLIRLYIVGTIMAALLYQRGFFVLHASAVEVDGGVIAFLGASGWGKSSIAAALYARGHSIVADDVTAVDLNSAAASVIPALPQLKLSREVASTLGYDGESLYRLHPLEEKRGFRITHGFAQSPLPLKGLYVLAKDTAHAIEPIRPSEAMVELVRHSYPTRLLQPGGPSHFRQCARLVKDIPIYRLKRSSSIAALPDLAQLVEGHLVRTRQLV